MRKRFKLLRPMLALVLVLSLLLPSLYGCALQKDDTLTVMIPLQKDSFVKFFSAFAEYYPDIAFDKTSYRGGSPSAYLQQRFEIGDLTDIVITSYPPDGETQKASLLDLAGNNFVHKYKSSVLNNSSVDGGIYFLDCPSSVRGIAYNKTMFAEHGWKIPESHEEFIALLRQIGADEPTIMPIGIQGKYPGTYFTLMSELSHCDFLQTPDGALWAQGFAAGTEGSLEGFGTGFELLEDWREAGAFTPEQATLGDSVVYQMLVDRECAMAYVMGSQNRLVELVEASSDSFGVLPLYGKGEDSEFVATTYGLKIGLNKRLGEPGNEKKLENALKLMEYLATEEGQMAFHTGKGDILPLTGGGATLSEIFEQVSGVIEKGHFAPFLYPGYEDVLASAGEYLRNAINSGGSCDGVFELMDEKRRESLNNEQQYIAVVEQTLNEDQTAVFVANALHAQGYGDLALISKGCYTEYFDVAGGANGKLYKGGIVTMAVNSPITNLNAQDAVTMTLTGAQVWELLESGRVLSDDEGHTEAFEYVAAGLTVERRRDGELISVTVGESPIDKDAVYKVAFSPQDYSEETALLGNPQNTGTPWQDAYRAYIVGLGTIKPEHANPT